MPAPPQCETCRSPLPANAPAGICPSCLLGQGAALAATRGSGSAPGKFATPTIDELSLLFPEFAITALLGRGGMGVVYKARQTALEREVAIKILPPEISGGDGELAERFRREAAVLARLDHPHIVRLHDFGERGGFAFFVMEFVDGTDLACRMQAAPLPRTEALRIAGDLCDALHYSHGRGIVHRDIKPSNILIARDGTVKIADFGLAKLVHPDDADLELTLTSAALGTPRYMAPEQISGAGTTDHRVDIYALGVVLYELLTGRYPAGKIGVPSEDNPGVHPLFDDVVLRALDPEPDTRYGDASQLKMDLADASAGRGLTRREKNARTARRRALVSIAAAAAGAAAAGSVILLRGRGRGTGLQAAPALSTSRLLAGGVLAPAPLSTAAAVAVSSADAPFALALDAAGKVHAWGDGRFGQTTPPRVRAAAVAAAQGPAGAHALALLADGTVAGWGDDTYRQASPPPGLRAKTIAAGEFHSLAIDMEGNVVSWGKTVPPPALKETRAIAAGPGFSIALAASGTVSVWGSFPSPPEGITTATAIAAGHAHALALLADGRVVSWGESQELPRAAARIFAGAGTSASLARSGELTSSDPALGLPTGGLVQLALGRGCWVALASE